MRMGRAMIAVLTVGSIASPLGAAGKGLLDGKTFAGEAGKKGSTTTTGEKDEVVFADGKFRSKGCDAFGFGDAPYTTTTKGPVTSWEAETTSPKEGKIHWKGTVIFDALVADYTWTKPGQAPIEYWFKAHVKK